MSEELPHDEELKALYRSLPAEEPPGGLDEAIVRAARRRADVEARRRLLGRLRWGVSLAAAAGLVLTLALTRLTPSPDCADCEGTAVPSVRKDAASPAARNEADQSVEARGRMENSEDARTQTAAAEPKPESFPSRSNTAEAPPAPAAAPPSPEHSASAAGPAPAPAAPSVFSERTLGYLAAKPPSRADALDMATRADNAALAVLHDWPFALEAGLDAGEVCRRVGKALATACEFRGNVAVIVPASAVAVDRGAYAGRMATRLTLTLQESGLARVAVVLVSASGSVEEVVLDSDAAR